MAAAREARARAYSPYSGFKVGAAVLAASGRVYVGCNVENCSFGLSLCAERVAIGTAVASGERELAAVAVYTETDRPTSPCGACRQVIAELGAASVVVMSCPSGQETRPLAELLPQPFSHHDSA